MKTPVVSGTGKSNRPRSRGFSLVEVTISLAIAGLGFVTLLGLLPQGMDLIRKTSEMSMGTKIIQKLTGELQTTSWDDMKWTGYGPRRYFTDDGVEIPADKLNGSASQYGLLTYVASVYLPDQTSNALLPALKNDGSEKYMRQAKICIATSTNPGFNFATAKSFRVTSCSVMIAKMSE